MHLEPWQWVLAVAAALLVGVSKTGLAGIGVLFVAIFANILPTKTGQRFRAAAADLRRRGRGGVVPAARAVAVSVAVVSLGGGWRGARLFRDGADRRPAGATADRWDHLRDGGDALVAAVARGGEDGGRWTEDGGRWSAGGGLGSTRSRSWLQGGGAGVVEEETHGVWFAPTMGVLAGFTTLVANAAGPLMALYLLAMRLPKMEFVGTGAVFFLLLNLFKVPFMVNLGLITTDSFGVNLALAPAVWLGAWAGRKLLRRLNQKFFENLALGLAAVAGLHLLFLKPWRG
jgi:hypothetical protein